MPAGMITYGKSIWRSQSSAQTEPPIFQVIVSPTRSGKKSHDDNLCASPKSGHLCRSGKFHLPSHMKMKDAAPQRKERFERVRIAPMLSDATNVLAKSTDAGVEVMSLGEFCYEDELAAAKFDLMNVQIVVYGLSGVLRCHAPKKRGRKFRFGGRGKGDRRGRTGRPSSTSKSSVTASNSSVSDMTPINDTPPVTALVSCKRNISSSGNFMETFLPSLPVSSAGSVFGDTARYSAAWPASEPDVYMGTDHIERSTFELIRVLKHEPYRSGSRMAQAMYYTPETVDIRISLCCGKEMIHLGFASFVITGDEEGEVVMNLPAKTKDNAWGESKPTTKTPREGSDLSAFSHSPKLLYQLDENATIRIGVRVVPQECVESRVSRARNGRTQEDDALKKLLAGIFDDQELVEISDENKLLEKLAPITNGDAQVRVDSQANLTTPRELGARGFFCGAIDGAIGTCSAERKRESGGIPEKILTVKKTAAELPALPLSLLSSVSESVTTMGSPATNEF